MFRSALIALLALAVLAPGAADASPRPKQRVLVTTCDRLGQAAVFEGRMDAIPGAVRMQLRFRLEVSTPDVPEWTRVAVPGFSSVLTSNPNRTRFVYAKRVEALLAPAAYRVQVRFRWLDANGGVLRTTYLRSRPCRLPDPRADLKPVGLTLGADARYDVAVRNAGRGAAAASTVTLVFPGGTTVSAPVPPMAAGVREDVFVNGPACAPGQSVAVTADSGDAVDESDEDNLVMLPCPPA
jgi:CARDB